MLHSIVRVVGCGGGVVVINVGMMSTLTTKVCWLATIDVIWLFRDAWTHIQALDDLTAHVDVVE